MDKLQSALVAAKKKMKKNKFTPFNKRPTEDEVVNAVNSGSMKEPAITPFSSSEDVERIKRIRRKLGR